MSLSIDRISVVIWLALWSFRTLIESRCFHCRILYQRISVIHGQHIIWHTHTPANPEACDSHYLSLGSFSVTVLLPVHFSAICSLFPINFLFFCRLQVAIQMLRPFAALPVSETGVWKKDSKGLRALQNMILNKLLTITWPQLIFLPFPLPIYFPFFIVSPPFCPFFKILNQSCLSSFSLTVVTRPKIKARITAMIKDEGLKADRLREIRQRLLDESSDVEVEDGIILTEEWRESAEENKPACIPGDFLLALHSLLSSRFMTFYVRHWITSLWRTRFTY